MFIPQVKSAGDAALLRRMIGERKSKVQQRSEIQTAYDTWDAPGIRIPARKLPALRGYVVVPKETIPGARLIGDELAVGSGTCCLMERDQSSGSNDVLVPSLDEAGNRVEVEVYNLCQEAIEPDTSQGSHECDLSCNDIVLFVTQDMNGDLYIVKDCQLPACSSSSSFSESGSESASASESTSQSASESQSQSQSASASASESVSGSVSTSESVSGSLSASGSESGSVSTSESISGSVSNSVNSVSGSVSGSISNSFSGSFSNSFSGSFSNSFSGSLSDGSVSYCNFVDSLNVITSISCTDCGISWTDGTLFWVGDVRPVGHSVGYWNHCCGGHLCFEEGEGGECNFNCTSENPPSLGSVQASLSAVVESLSGLQPSLGSEVVGSLSAVVESLSGAVSSLSGPLEESVGGGGGLQI